MIFLIGLLASSLVLTSLYIVATLFSLSIGIAVFPILVVMGATGIMLIMVTKLPSV